MRGEAIPIEVVLRELNVSPPDMSGVRSEAEFVARWEVWLSEDVKRAYRARMLELHPDKHEDKSPEEQQALLRRTQQVNHYHDLLCAFDPRKALPRRPAVQVVRVMHYYSASGAASCTSGATTGSGAHVHIRWQPC